MLLQDHELAKTGKGESNFDGSGIDLIVCIERDDRCS
jgi:hypothetical protein